MTNLEDAQATGYGGPYTVYAAGGLFTQHDLTSNVLVKEAVWRFSGGKFQLFLPQSREMQEYQRSDIVAHIRNTDLIEVLKADVVMVRFDGLELDSGTVVEFIFAKVLGKPTVILRSDFRGMHSTGLSEPYNLMVKNWPRTVEIHLDSYILNAGFFAEELKALGGTDPFQAMMQAELNAFQKGVDEIARKIIGGFEAALMQDSPYPPEYQEMVYKALKHSPGSGFEQLLTKDELEEIIKRLMQHGTL